MLVALDGRCLTAHYPGVGRYAFNLLRALPRVAPPEVEIAAFLGDEDERFPHAELEGVRRLPVDAPIRGLRGQIVLPRKLRGIGADVFHSPYIVTAYRSLCPLVVTVHDAIGVRSRELLPSPFARLAFRLTTHLALRAARAVITPSEASKRDLVRYFGAPEERIEVIPEAAAPEFRPAPADAVAELTARRGLPPRYALFLGTAKPHKNLERLVRAWAALGDEACPLVVAGRRDPRYPEPERLGADVRFVGEVPEADLPALLTGAEVLVQPSLCEGFGLPVVEAMACGTPVACSNVSSLPEVAGEAAAYFDPRNLESMVETFRRLFADASYRRELAERGLARAASFSWERTAERTLQVYRRILPDR